MRWLLTASRLTYHDLPVVQGLRLLLKFLPDCEVDLVVSEGAQGLGLESVSFLDDHLCLVQVVRDLPGGEVDVWKHRQMLSS